MIASVEALSVLRHFFKCCLLWEVWVKTENLRGETPEAGHVGLLAAWKLELFVKGDSNRWGSKYFCTHVRKSVKRQSWCHE